MEWLCYIVPFIGLSTAYQDYVGGREVHNEERNNHLGHLLKGNVSNYHFFAGLEVALAGALKNIVVWS
ncbi:MAG: hypothetical protein ABS982_02240 [Pseudomonas simiae]